MIITINVDTNHELNDTDRAVLQGLLYGTGTAPAPAAPVTPVRTQAKTAPKKAAPAAAPVAEPDPEPEAAGDEDDVLGGGKPTLSDAIARATEMVSNGHTAKVKAALATVNAKRVSELTDKTLDTFLASLDEQD